MHAGKVAEHTAACTDNLSRPYYWLNGIGDVFADGNNDHCYDVEGRVDV